MVAALFFEKAEIEIGTELRVTSWLGATGPVPQTPREPVAFCQRAASPEQPFFVPLLISERFSAFLHSSGGTASTSKDNLRFPSEHEGSLSD